jgi:putative transposase
MPDHLHALIQPTQCRDTKPTTFSTPLKRITRQRTSAKWHWQEGVFDRLLRKNEFVETKWHYMRENPVRAGLVRSWQDWPYLIEGKL